MINLLTHFSQLRTEGGPGGCAVEQNGEVSYYTINQGDSGYPGGIYIDYDPNIGPSALDDIKNHPYSTFFLKVVAYPDIQPYSEHIFGVFMRVFYNTGGIKSFWNAPYTDGVGGLVVELTGEIDAPNIDRIEIIYMNSSKDSAISVFEASLEIQEKVVEEPNDDRNWKDYTPYFGAPVFFEDGGDPGDSGLLPYFDASATMGYELEPGVWELQAWEGTLEFTSYDNELLNILNSNQPFDISFQVEHDLQTHNGSILLMVAFQTSHGYFWEYDYLDTTSPIIKLERPIELPEGVYIEYAELRVLNDTGYTVRVSAISFNITPSTPYVPELVDVSGDLQQYFQSTHQWGSGHFYEEPVLPVSNLVGYRGFFVLSSENKDFMYTIKQHDDFNLRLSFTHSGVLDEVDFVIGVVIYDSTRTPLQEHIIYVTPGSTDFSTLIPIDTSSNFEVIDITLENRTGNDIELSNFQLIKGVYEEPDPDPDPEPEPTPQVNAYLRLTFKNGDTLDVKPDTHIQAFSILTELDTAKDGLIGNISANTISFTLNNDDGIFTLTNAQSPYYQFMGEGVQVEFYRDDVKRGTFFVTDWDAPNTAGRQEARITAVDRLQSVLNTPVELLDVERDITVSEYIAKVLLRAGYTGEVVIDPSLTQKFDYTIASGAKLSSILNDIALCTDTYIYIDETDTLRVTPKAITGVPVHEITGSTNLVSATPYKSILQSSNVLKLSYVNVVVGEVKTLLTIPNHKVKIGTNNLNNYKVEGDNIFDLDSVQVLAPAGVTVLCEGVRATQGSISLEVSNYSTQDDVPCDITVKGRALQTTETHIQRENTELVDKNGRQEIAVVARLIQSNEDAESLIEKLWSRVQLETPYLQVETFEDDFVYNLGDIVNVSSQAINLNYQGYCHSISQKWIASNTVRTTIGIKAI